MAGPKIRKKDRPGREVIDWNIVKNLCTIQCTRDEICAVLDISADKINDDAKKRFKLTFKELMEQWRVGGKCSLRRKQWMLADTSATMAIFLGKQYLGQTDDYKLSHSGTTMEVVHYGDIKAMTWQQKAARNAIHE